MSALPAGASLQPATGFHSPVRVATPTAQLPALVPSVTGDLTLSVSKTKIAYRKSVTVTAHLGDDPGENPQVSIFRTPAGGSSPEDGLFGLKLFIDAHASISVPSTEK